MITMILAMSLNGVIGRDGRLPWHIKEDMKRFKAYTMGKTVLMGRKTFESIGKPLPGRVNVVLSRQIKDGGIPGVTVINNITDLAAVPVPESGDTEVVIIGGSKLYRDLIGVCDKLVVTHVQTVIDGDVYAPAIDWSEWERSGTAEVVNEDGYCCVFAEYVRKSR